MKLQECPALGNSPVYFSYRCGNEGSPNFSDLPIFQGS